MNENEINIIENAQDLSEEEIYELYNDIIESGKEMYIAKGGRTGGGGR